MKWIFYHIVCEETVAYLAIGKNNEIFVFTDEDPCIPKHINNDVNGVFVKEEDCHRFCGEPNQL